LGSLKIPAEAVLRMSNPETGEEMFRAKTAILFFSYQQQKVVPVPEDFVKRITAQRS